MAVAYRLVHAAALFLPSKVHLVDDLVRFQSRSIFQTRIDLRGRERLNSERAHRQEATCGHYCLQLSLFIQQMPLFGHLQMPPGMRAEFTRDESKA